MTLENIIEKYGWNDYLDMHTGYVYLLSKAKTKGDGTSKVAVVDNIGNLVGFANVNKVKE